jgi:hypothetical protein
MIFAQVENYPPGTVALTGYLVVFSSLVLLYFVFFFLPKLLKLNFRKADKEELQAAKEARYESDITGEMNAAIGTALHMYFNEMHDDEDLTLTIERVSKRYSPWSSKIYGVTQHLNKRF